MLTNLCSDVLLGKISKSVHKQVSFQYECEKDNFFVSKTSCGLPQHRLSFDHFIKTYPKIVRQFAVKSQRFNTDDQLLYIGQAIDRLRSEGIVKQSILLWRAQIVVVKIQKIISGADAFVNCIYLSSTLVENVHR